MEAQRPSRNPKMKANQIPQNPPGLSKETEVSKGKPKSVVGRMLDSPSNARRNSEAADHIENDPIRPPPSLYGGARRREEIKECPQWEISGRRAWIQKRSWRGMRTVPTVCQKRAFEVWTFEFGFWFSHLTLGRYVRF